MSTRSPHERMLVVGLASAGLLALELIWTRLFSAEFYYPYAFLVLSLALLGLGLGALVVRIVPPLRREACLAPVLALTALCALAGPPLVFRLGLSFRELYTSWSAAYLFLLAVLLLASAFFFGGMALAHLFRSDPERIQRLYMSDLLGAGLGVVGGVALMNAAGTQAATFLCSLPLLAAAWVAGRSVSRVLTVVLGAGLVVLLFQAGDLLRQEREERAPVMYEHWDAMSKVKVYDYNEDWRGINIDNMANTPVGRFDGDWESLTDEPPHFGIDVGYLLGLFEEPTFLSLGAGGGGDVMQALWYGAEEVHAVEVNAHINHMMLVGDPGGYLSAEERARREAPREEEGESAEEEAEDEAEAQEEQASEEAEQEPAPEPQPVATMAEFTGRLYHDPRVRVVSEDARIYAERFEERFDLIYSLSSNTFAAIASGSFAMAESYLFTTEAFRAYWRALSEDGFLSMEHQYYMPRLVASLIEALEEVGVEDPAAHFAVYDLPRMRRNLLLLSKQPLSEEIIHNAYGELTPESYDDIHLLWPAADGLEENLINRIVLEGWESVAESADVDVSPSTDDKPFVGQMGLWRNRSWEGREQPKMEIYGYPLAQILVLTILGVVLVLFVPLNLLPYLGRGAKLRAVPWLYFFTIGAGFMVVEVALIQRATLFVGPSAYSIATILLALLLCSGLGSRVAGKIPDALPFVGVILWLLLEVFWVRGLIGAASDMGMTERMLLTALWVAPLGFFLGMPFPKAALRVGELVDWGFAVNGSASVLGATGVLLVAFSWGLGAALLLGAGLYLIALVLLSRRAAW